MTAISLHAYPFVQDRYALLPHGASIGSGYGPVVVAREPLTLRPAPVRRDRRPRPDDDRVPRRCGSRSASSRHRELPFDRILDEVASGRADAGLVIHEGQLTYEEAGLHKVLDLGEWWLLETGLPLPLGVNVARRDLGERLARPLRGAARLDPGRARQPPRGDALRDALRPRDRPDDGRPLRRHVRERAHVRLRRRGPHRRSRSCSAAATRSARFPSRSASTTFPRMRAARSSSPPCARRSAATAAASRASGPTISPRSRSRPRSSAPASTPAEIEDVYLGCANQAGEDNRNVARMAALLAGLPESVAGVTVNRLCASGLSAVVGACHAIAAGDGDLFVAGGVESMSRAPLVDGEAGRGLPARRPHDVRHDARLALPEPRARGEVPARVDGRDGRERGRALGRLARGPGRVRAPLAAALGGGRLRRRARRRRASSSATSTRARTRAPRSSPR